MASEDSVGGRTCGGIFRNCLPTISSGPCNSVSTTRRTGCKNVLSSSSNVSTYLKTAFAVMRTPKIEATSPQILTASLEMSPL